MGKQETVKTSQPSHYLPLIFIILAAIFPTNTYAHARLKDSVPLAGAHLTSPPQTIELNFSGPVVATKDGVQVFGHDGTRVDSGNPFPEQGTSISQKLKPNGSGTYGIAYRVSSEDGHVITGFLGFVVGAENQAAANTDSDTAKKVAKDAAKTSHSLEVSFTTVRTIELLLLLIVSGGGIFACLIAPQTKPKWLIPAAILLFLSYLAAYALNAALVTNANVSSILSANQLALARKTPFGVVMQLRALALLVVIAPLLLLNIRKPPLPQSTRIIFSIMFLGLASSAALTGHAVTTQPLWIRLPSDIAHLIAASIWVGGLVQVWFLSEMDHASIKAAKRYSTLAFICVIALLISGSISTLTEIGLRPNELVSSLYGRLIVAKIILLLALIPLAWNNRDRFVPYLEERSHDARRMLRQYAGREFLMLIAVIALTAWLTSTPQP